MIGTMSVFGVRKRLPRKDSEVVIQNLDLVNAIPRIDLYISASKIKVRLFAFRHVIGETSSCIRLTTQISSPEPVESESNAAVRTHGQSTIRLRSKFDFRGSVYEVLEELPNETIRAVCKWDSLAGDEQFFNKEDGLCLVNQKRGQN